MSARWQALGRALVAIISALRPRPVDPVEHAKAAWAADPESSVADLDWTLDRVLGRTKPYGVDWSAFFLT